jgi:uncharacterized protein (TIGR03083 family)
MDVQQLAAAWREFAATAAAALEGVAAEAWQRPTQYPEWTGHDLLAHLSSTQKVLPRMVESAFAPPTASGSGEPFDADRWNASQVRRRREQPTERLLEEFREGGSELTIMIEHRVRPEDLDRPVPTGAGRGRPLGEVLERLLEHQRRHLSDLLQAVDATR